MSKLYLVLYTYRYGGNPDCWCKDTPEIIGIYSNRGLAENQVSKWYRPADCKIKELELDK